MSRERVFMRASCPGIALLAAGAGTNLEQHPNTRPQHHRIPLGEMVEYDFAPLLIDAGEALKSNSRLQLGRQYRHVSSRARVV